VKNVMPRFPTDVADVPMFFEGVDKLFGSFEVPDDLRAKLLLLCFSDEVNSLFLRLEQAKREKHSEVKALLLKELKLTPIQFKKRFDRATRNKDEICTDARIPRRERRSVWSHVLLRFLRRWVNVTE
jgi:hypothetical protein